MKKPSLKNKLTADKIEAANRLLVEQLQSETAPAIVKPSNPTPSVPEPTKEIISTDKVEKKEISVKKTAKKTLIEESISAKMVRVTVDIPENIHEKLKIKMILSKKTIKQYLLDFIEKDLAKSDLRI